MGISDAELQAMEPTQAMCTDAELIVTLANGQKVVRPLSWYPHRLEATPKQRANYELSPFGVHWPDIDEESEHRRDARGRQGARRQGAGAGVTMRRRASVGTPQPRICRP